jgi:thioesterase domain-containing protein/acyl carrier protein
MLPAAFVPMDALPLTPNGKLDRKSLPAPIISGQGGPHDHAARAFTPTERELAQIFSALLAVETPSLRDNFFQLGGHSLVGVRLLYEIQNRFGAKLTLASLFAGPTIEQLARVIDNLDKGGRAWPVVPLQTEIADAPIFMVQWIERDLASHLGRRHAVYGLHCPLTDPDRDGGEGAPRRIEDLAAFYLLALRSVQPCGPYRLIGHSFGGLVAYEMAQQLLRQNEKVAFLGLLDTHVPAAFEDSAASLFREKLKSLLGLRPNEIWSVVSDSVRLRCASAVSRLRRIVRDPRLGAQFEHEIAVKWILRYEMAPYAGQVHFFKSRDPKPNLLPAALKDPDVPWRPFVKGGVQAHDIPGSHIGFVKDPIASVTAAAIEQCLDV